MFSITNTVSGFAWLVNYLETYMSCNVWQPMTSASIANRFMEIVSEYYEKTGCTRDVRTACGDFSMRGMSSEDTACKSSAGHLLSFTSTATIPVVNWLEQFYNADVEKELICMGTASTEHSVMCTYGREELDCFRHLITEQFPKGNLSIVSDTYDYWGIFENVLPVLKDEIMARDGKVIIRGDSGNPVDIICGTQVSHYLFDDANIDWFFENNKIIRSNGSYYKAVDYDNGDLDGIFIRPKENQGKHGEDLVWVYCNPTSEVKGTVECLWDIFGGTINEKGYKVLDPHIGTIYGDGITLERCEEICKRLEAKGFATENVTFGIGSFSYAYNTRDTLGFALKATNSFIDGVETPIYKDPKTDKDNFKKSQKGNILVFKENGEITYRDKISEDTYTEMCQYYDDLLKPVFKNGNIVKEFSLSEIRETLANQLK